MKFERKTCKKIKLIEKKLHSKLNHLDDNFKRQVVNPIQQRLFQSLCFKCLKNYAVKFVEK